MVKGETLVIAPIMGILAYPSPKKKNDNKIDNRYENIDLNDVNALILRHIYIVFF